MDDYTDISVKQKSSIILPSHVCSQQGTKNSDVINLVSILFQQKQLELNASSNHFSKLTTVVSSVSWYHSDVSYCNIRAVSVASVGTLQPRWVVAHLVLSRSSRGLHKDMSVW